MVALTLALAGAGCFAAPETCIDCNDGAGGSGAGGVHGGGGMLGSGGTTTGAGGTATGAGGTTTGAGGAGGKGTGGSMSTGGTGMGGSSTGGTGAGGSGMGGSSMGGSGMGGAGMGGSGMGGSGMGGAGVGGAGGAIDVALVAWYKLDDGSGTSALDSSGHARNGTLSAVGGGTAAFSTTHQVGTGSLNLTSNGGQGVGGLLTVPASLQTMGATTAITISCWVNVRNNRAWERIFDFGNSMATGYMFLTAQQAQNAPNSVRFAISQTGNTGEQAINMNTPAVLSTGVWHHIAVTLGTGTTYTGTLYIDKVVAGTNNAMTLRPSNLGNTPNNWIGQSQFTVDPMFDGFIDDFRIYSRALSAAEIAALP